MKAADEIDLLGYTFVGFIDELRTSILERLRQGARIRILLVDPTTIAGKLMMQQNPHTKYPCDVRIVLDRYEEIKGQEACANMELRLLRWIPSCSMVILNGSKESGRMKIGIYPLAYSTRMDERAYFSLARGDDQRWYPVFLAQYNKLWERAKPYDPVLKLDLSYVKMAQKIKEETHL